MAGDLDSGAQFVQVLLGIAQSLTSAVDLDARLGTICTSAVQLLGCDRSSIFLREGDRFRAFVNHGNPPAVAAVFPAFSIGVEDPIVAAAGDSFVVVNDTSASPLFNPRLAAAARIDAIVVATLAVEDDVVGFMTAEYNERAGRFGDQEAALVTGLARLAALSVVADRRERARSEALEQLALDARLHAALGRLGRAAITSSTEETLLQAAVDLVGDALQSDSVSFRNDQWIYPQDFTPAAEHPVAVLGVEVPGVGRLAVGGAGEGDRAFLEAVAAIVAGAVERLRAERRSRHDALHDPLTGLPNRGLLMDRLAHALQTSPRSDSRVAVLFIDLDRFKVVNDSLGHEAGDEVLQRIADEFRTAVRPGDTLARFGGDEFVVCALVTSPQDAVLIAERLVAVAGTPVRVHGHELVVSASVGVAVSDRGDRPSVLLRNADAAMYRAKTAGRGRFVVFDESMERLVLTRLETETALRDAVSNGGLDLHYQPVIDLTDGAVVGVEALLRWRHPERGLLTPADFLGLAEEIRVMDEIAVFTLDRACADLRGARPAGPFEVSVNLSPAQLVDERLPSWIASTLERWQVPSDRLVVEVTEHALLTDTLSARNAMNVLQDLGVRLAIDDFGTGYSALGYLRHFSFDILKIDHSFVAELDRDGRSRHLLEAVLHMARALGLVSIAEGVERPEQAAILAELGCDRVQGFLYSRPAPVGQLATALGRLK